MAGGEAAGQCLKAPGSGRGGAASQRVLLPLRSQATHAPPPTEAALCLRRGQGPWGLRGWKGPLVSPWRFQGKHQAGGHGGTSSARNPTLLVLLGVNAA